jgi:hypothetical protein
MEEKIQAQIIDIVEQLTKTKITTKNRKRENVTARAVYAKLAKDLIPSLTLAKIAAPINRDHATVIHLFKMIENHLYRDNYYINLYKKASTIINKDVIHSGDFNKLSYLESLEERIIRLSNALIDKNKEVEELKEKIPEVKYSDIEEKYLEFQKIPEELFQTFIETRLNPFLKLNSYAKT